MEKGTMRTVAVALLVLLPCVPAHALLAVAPYGTIDGIAGAENLLIVRVPARDGPERVAMGADGVMEYEVVILKLLNGNTVKKVLKDSIMGERNEVAISSIRKLEPGARYLLAGGKASRDDKPWLLSRRENGVVRLPDRFDLSQLKGKDVKAQVAAILSARRDHVARQIEKLNREKKLLDLVLPGKKGKSDPKRSPPAAADKPRR